MLKRLGTAAIFAVCLATVVYAAPPTRGVNALGAAGAPVAVSTTTKVIPGDSNRTSYCIVPEDGAIRCEYGGIDDSAPTVTPTGSVGGMVPQGTFFCSSRSPGGVTWSSLTVERRVQCAATSGTVHVSTFEEPY